MRRTSDAEATCGWWRAIRVRYAIVAASFGVLLMTGIANAAPETTRIDLSIFSEAETRFASRACGFPIEAELQGHIITTVFSEGPNPHVSIDRFNIRATYTNPATGETTRLVDAGPDIVSADTVAVIGRSVTGSGVIGRVVFDLETGEILFKAGRRVNAGDTAYIRAVCRALAS